MANRRERRAKQRRQRQAPAADSSVPDLRIAGSVTRLAYTRRQAAEALGLSLTTLDRRVIPLIDTIKTPWGARLIPVDELERLLNADREPARQAEPKPRGRPPETSAAAIERIRRERRAGRSLAAIAAGLNGDDVPTARPGSWWWPSTVRHILQRAGAQ